MNSICQSALSLLSLDFQLDFVRSKSRIFYVFLYSFSTRCVSLSIRISLYACVCVCVGGLFYSERERMFLLLVCSALWPFIQESDWKFERVREISYLILVWQSAYSLHTHAHNSRDCTSHTHTTSHTGVYVLCVRAVVAKRSLYDDFDVVVFSHQIYITLLNSTLLYSQIHTHTHTQLTIIIFWCVRARERVCVCARNRLLNSTTCMMFS